MISLLVSFQHIRVYAPLPRPQDGLAPFLSCWSQTRIVFDVFAGLEKARKKASAVCQLLRVNMLIATPIDAAAHMACASFSLAGSIRLLPPSTNGDGGDDGGDNGDDFVRDETPIGRPRGAPSSSAVAASS